MTERRTDEERAREFLEWCKGDSARDADQPELQDRLAAEFARVRAEAIEECAKLMEERAIAYNRKSREPSDSEAVHAAIYHGGEAIAAMMAIRSLSAPKEDER